MARRPSRYSRYNRYDRYSPKSEVRRSPGGYRASPDRPRVTVTEKPSGIRFFAVDRGASHRVNVIKVPNFGPRNYSVLQPLVSDVRRRRVARAPRATDTPTSDAIKDNNPLRQRPNKVCKPRPKNNSPKGGNSKDFVPWCERK